MLINLSENVGNKVSLVELISTTPWQHLIKTKETYENIKYLDLDEGDHIVIYSKKPLKYQGRIKITSQVIEVTGKSKRPGDASEEVYRNISLLLRIGNVLIRFRLFTILEWYSCLMKMRWNTS